MKNLGKAILLSQVASCSCDTKTPDPAYHRGTCKFRMAKKIEGSVIEMLAELIYLREHGGKGAVWSANDSKDVWRDKAREELGFQTDTTKSEE